MEHHGFHHLEKQVGGDSRQLHSADPDLNEIPTGFLDSIKNHSVP